jgi:hypothetical protein
MKPKFYLAIFIASILLFASCKKWLPENRIVGSWKLFSVDKKYLFSSDRIYTGYENGLFVFNDNGTATYSDTSIQMNGSWIMREEHDGYYDGDGNWHQDGRTILTIRLYNFAVNRIVDWYFNSIDFRSSGEKLISFMDSPSFTYKYDFRKQ